MMAREHAALKTMRKHGVHAVESEFLRDTNGSPYLMTKRFDRTALPVTPDVQGNFTVQPGHKEQTLQFAPVAWELTTKNGKLNLRNGDDTTHHLMEKPSRTVIRRLKICF